MTLHRMLHKMRFKPGDVLVVRSLNISMEQICRAGRASGIKFGVPIILAFERSDLRKISFEKLERAYLDAREVRDHEGIGVAESLSADLVVATDTASSLPSTGL